MSQSYTFLLYWKVYASFVDSPVDSISIKTLAFNKTQVKYSVYPNGLNQSTEEFFLLTVIVKSAEETWKLKVKLQIEIRMIN